MKTAVEWLEEQFKLNLNFPLAPKYQDLVNTAKEMEKEQMLDIYINHNQYNDNFLGFEDYYNETFKTK